MSKGLDPDQMTKVTASKERVIKMFFLLIWLMCCLYDADEVGFDSLNAR